MQLVLEPKLLGVVYFLKELATDKGKKGQEQKKKQAIRLFHKRKRKRPKKQLRRLSRSTKVLQSREDKKKPWKGKEKSSRG